MSWWYYTQPTYLYPTHYYTQPVTTTHYYTQPQQMMHLNQIHYFYWTISKLPNDADIVRSYNLGILCDNLIEIKNWRKCTAVLKITHEPIRLITSCRNWFPRWSYREHVVFKPLDPFRPLTKIWMSYIIYPLNKYSPSKSYMVYTF